MSCDGENLGCVIVGSDRTVDISIFEADGTTPQDLTGFGLSVTGAGAGLTLGPYTIGSGITVTGTGTAALRIPKEDIASVTKETKVSLRLTITDLASDDDVKKIGYFKIEP